MSRRALHLVLAVASVAAGFVGLASLADASANDPAADEAGFAGRIDGERAGRSLGALTVREDLVIVARRHAAEMARRGRVGHYGNLSGEVSGWQKLGENVGAGASVDEVHGMFMGSSTHRGEILDPSYRDVGVGVVWSGGRLWVSEIFRTPSGAPAPAPAPAPPPPPPAAPPPTRVPQARASRSDTAVAPVASQPAPPPPPPPAPAPTAPPPPPATTTTAAPPDHDFRDAERLARRRVSPPADELAAEPIGTDADADVATLLVLTGAIVAAGALAAASGRRP